MKIWVNKVILKRREVPNVHYHMYTQDSNCFASIPRVYVCVHYHRLSLSAWKLQRHVSGLKHKYSVLLCASHRVPSFPCYYPPNPSVLHVMRMSRAPHRTRYPRRTTFNPPARVAHRSSVMLYNLHFHKFLFVSSSNFMTQPLYCGRAIDKRHSKIIFLLKCKKIIFKKKNSEKKIGGNEQGVLESGIILAIRHHTSYIIFMKKLYSKWYFGSRDLSSRHKNNVQQTERECKKCISGRPWSCCEASRELAISAY